MGRPSRGAADALNLGQRRIDEQPVDVEHAQLHRELRAPSSRSGCAPESTTSCARRSAAARSAFTSGERLLELALDDVQDPAGARARTPGPCATGPSPSPRSCEPSRTPAPGAGRRAPPCRGSTSRGSSRARRRRACVLDGRLRLPSSSSSSSTSSALGRLLGVASAASSDLGCLSLDGIVVLDRGRCAAGATTSISGSSGRPTSSAVSGTVSFAGIGGRPTRALTRGARPDIPFAGCTGRAAFAPRPPSDGRDLRVILAFALLVSIFRDLHRPVAAVQRVPSWPLRDIRTSLIKYSGFDRRSSRNSDAWFGSLVARVERFGSNMRSVAAETRGARSDPAERRPVTP